MRKKLTLTIDAEVYDGLRRIVGPGKISRFVEDLVRPHVLKQDLIEGYRTMAADRVRESEALDWAESTCGDGGSTKVMTSIALSEDVLARIDRHHGEFRSRSEFLECAARAYLAHLARTEAERRDLEIINRDAVALNAEAEDVLAYQVLE